MTMTNAFVWFHNASKSPNDSVAFYQKLLGWTPSDGPPGMTMLGGDAGPFAAIAAAEGPSTGWIPYVQVEDVDAATRKAAKLGGVVLEGKTRGPAGEFTIVRDPGGAAIALWQKA